MTALQAWNDCSHVMECISPRGSDRSNHRQDQSAWTVLAHMYGYDCPGYEGSSWWHHPIDHTTKLILDDTSMTEHHEVDTEYVGGDRWQLRRSADLMQTAPRLSTRRRQIGAHRSALPARTAALWCRLGLSSP